MGPWGLQQRLQDRQTTSVEAHGPGQCWAGQGEAVEAPPLHLCPLLDDQPQSPSNLRGGTYSPPLEAGEGADSRRQFPFHVWLT